MTGVQQATLNDDDLRRALAYLYRNPDALPESLRAALLSARSAGPPVELDEPTEPDEDDVEVKADDDEDDDPDDDPDDDEDDRPEAAGVVLLAADTGRALMLQRSYDDPDDPARGTWEFPGGGLEDDDATPLDGAIREWTEEVGHPIPDGYVEGHAWRSPNGVYAGHTLIIPSEDALDLSAERTIVNPDDDHEQVAWWDLGHAMRNPALRRECQRTPWNAIKRSLAAVRKATNVGEKGAGVWPEVKVAGDRDGDGIPDAKDPTPGGSPAGRLPDKGKGGKKRRVASAAGSRRYHLPIGAEIGTARDDDAAKAQEDPKAREAYQTLLTANPREYRAMLDKMGDAELESLSRVAYSFRSSNPQVVQARIALAGALRRRGKDVNDFGGLGKGRPAGRANTGAATHPGTANRRTGGAATPAKYAGRKYVDAEGLSDSDRDALLKAGWKGRPDDGKERLYPPAGSSSRSRSGSSPAGARSRAGGSSLPPGEDASWVPGETWQARRARRSKLGLMGRSVPPTAKTKRGEGGKLMTLHIYEDGSWQYKGVAPGAEVIETSDGAYVIGEVKAAAPAPTDPWERAMRQAAEVKGASKGDKGGTDDPGIKTVGDLAAAIKRARSSKDPAVRAKIRAAAKRIGGPATNMIPKDWGSDSGGKDDKGKGKGGWTPPWEKALPVELETMDPFALAAYIEAKAMSPDPSAAKLREYWAHGAGRKKWRPGTGGDFERLRRHLRKYVPAHMLNGLTANIHKLATGEWPGKHAHGGKSVYGDDVEVKISADMLAEAAELDPTGGDDDAITLALDRYSDMADELTSEEEYEEALAREVDWDLLPDGTLERADGQGGHRVLDDAKLGDDDGDEGPSSDPDDALAGLEEMLAG